MGLLIEHAMPQWHRNRYGSRLSVNLNWNGLEASDDEAARRNPQPPSAGISAESRPPESNTKLPPLEERNNQKPEAGAATGFCNCEKGREEPTIAHVVPQDLADMRRLMALHRQAVDAKVVTPSDSDRLAFVGAAQHALAVGSQNPPGLFAWLIRNRKWAHLTQVDEESARKRLQAWRYGTDPAARTTRESRAGRLLSRDAHLVRTIRQLQMERGCDGDALAELQRRDPSWTRDRWEQACVELGLRRLPVNLPAANPGAPASTSCSHWRTQLQRPTLAFLSLASSERMWQTTQAPRT